MSAWPIVAACTGGLVVFWVLTARFFSWVAVRDRQAPQPPQLVPDRIPEWMASGDTPPSRTDGLDGRTGDLP